MFSLMISNNYMRTINGKLLKDMLISAANNLYNHYPEIDALNVFPVPDGDTGMNMNLTVTSGAKEIINRSDEDVYSIAQAFSKGLLMGARGNSGVITSQIFRGFAIALKDKKTIDAIDLADAFANGSTIAYKAVMRPVEGTILTVIRESSAALSEAVHKSMSIEKAMEIILKEAKESLKRTPELLPVLKEVGVVDSGGTGLVTILEGMKSAIYGDIIEKINVTSVDEKPAIIGGPSLMGDSDDEFGYCTEFIMRLGPDATKKPFNERRFKSVLESRGNSIVVVIDEDIVKVHIHTLSPGDILSYAQNFGEFLTLKIENMTEQHTKLTEGVSKEENNQSLKEKIPYGMIAISAGKGLDELFKELGVNKIVNGGQTMNPSTEDIVNAIKEVNAKDVYIFPNNSNIIMAAMQAKDVVDEEYNVHVITTKTIPQGISAVSVFNPDANAIENEEAMNDATQNVTSGSITYAIKDTLMNGVEIEKGYFIGIKDKNIVTCHKDKFATLYELISDMVNEDSFLITILLGEDISVSDEEKIVNKLSNDYPNLDIDIRRGDQPVYSFLIGVE